MSSTLMNDMAEKHNGMFGQVVKKSIRKLFPGFTKEEQWLVRYQKLLHTTKPILLLPRKQRMIMIYEYLNGCMSNPKNRGVKTRINPHHHLRDYPMIIDSLRCYKTALSPNPIFHPHILQSRKGYLHKFQFGIKMARLNRKENMTNPIPF